MNNNTVKAIMDDMFETYKEKNRNYGNSFEKVRDEYKKDFPVILIRLSDKLSRLKTLMEKEQFVTYLEESIEDTLMDLANYAIMEVACRKDENRDGIIKTEHPEEYSRSDYPGAVL